jgi:hypothetical protein
MGITFLMAATPPSRTLSSPTLPQLLEGAEHVAAADDADEAPVVGNGKTPVGTIEGDPRHIDDVRPGP